MRETQHKHWKKLPSKCFQNVANCADLHDFWYFHSIVQNRNLLKFLKLGAEKYGVSYNSDIVLY